MSNCTLRLIQVIRKRRLVTILPLVDIETWYIPFNRYPAWLKYHFATRPLLKIQLILNFSKFTKFYNLLTPRQTTLWGVALKLSLRDGPPPAEVTRWHRCLSILIGSDSLSITRGLPSRHGKFRPEVRPLSRPVWPLHIKAQNSQFTTSDLYFNYETASQLNWISQFKLSQSHCRNSVGGFPTELCSTADCNFIKHRKNFSAVDIWINFQILCHWISIVLRLDVIFTPVRKAYANFCTFSLTYEYYVSFSARSNARLTWIGATK